MRHSRLLILSLSIVLAVAVAGPAAQRWRFVVTCDSRGDVLTGINEPILREIAREVVRQNPDFLAYPGDLVYGGRLAPQTFEDFLWRWIRAMKPVYDARIPVYVCRGNHEVGDMWDAEPNQSPNPADNDSLRWRHVFGNPDYPQQKLPDNGPADARYMSYSVVHKNALIVAVDQYGGMNHHLVHQVDQRWVNSVLNSNTRPHVFVFGHEPAFRLAHPDCLDDHPAQRDRFWRSLQTAGVRMYFCGHDHFFNHAWVDDGDDNPANDVHQLDVATAGAPGYTWWPPYFGENSYFDVALMHHAEGYGYVVVDIDGLDVTATWIARTSIDPADPPVYLPGHSWSYRASTAKPSPDLNGDGAVDLADLAIFSSRWLMPDQD